MLNSVSSTTGSTQPGLRTMSSKVVFGEKNTPTTRPTGLIAGCDCASGAGIDVVVAIEVPPHRGAVTGAFPPRSTLHYARTPHKLSGGPTVAFYGVRQQHSRQCRGAALPCPRRASPASSPLPPLAATPTGSGGLRRYVAAGFGLPLLAPTLSGRCGTLF